MITADYLLPYLGSTKRSGDKFICHCPWADEHHKNSDKNPSFTLFPEGNGHCHTIGKSYSVREIAEKIGCQIPSQNSSTTQLEKVYPYTDENGKVLYEKVRGTGKKFFQRRPDGTGRCISDLKGVTPLLFRLDKLLKANPDETLFITEGEKDVETLEGFGLLATTSGGTGSWKNEFKKYFQNRDVVIVPDQDEPGQKLSRKIIESIGDSAQSIRIVNVPQGTDISDWVALGKTKQDFEALLSNTSPIDPTIVKKIYNDPIHLVHIGTLLEKKIQTVDWIVQDLLPGGGLSIVAASPKTGKSTLARQLALSVARGQPFLGRSTQQGHVFYFALEERERVVQKHFLDMGSTGEEDIKIHSGLINSPQAMEKFCCVVKEEKPALVIVDPIAHLSTIRDFNDYGSVIAALSPFISLAQDTGSHFCLLHHNRKGNNITIDSVLGSAALSGSVDTIVLLSYKESYRTIKTRQREGEDLGETILNFDPATRTSSLAGTKKELDVRKIQDEIIAVLEERSPISRAKLEKKIEGKTETLRQAMKYLVETGQIHRTGSGKKGDPHIFQLGQQNACSRVPAISTGQENKNQKNVLTHQNHSANACSQNSEEWKFLGAEDPDKFDEWSDLSK